MKMSVIKQFLKDVDWGDLDYLVIDSPSGNRGRASSQLRSSQDNLRAQCW